MVGCDHLLPFYSDLVTHLNCRSNLETLLRVRTRCPVPIVSVPHLSRWSWNRRGYTSLVETTNGWSTIIHRFLPLPGGLRGLHPCHGIHIFHELVLWSTNSFLIVGFSLFGPNYLFHSLEILLTELRSFSEISHRSLSKLSTNLNISIIVR